MAHTSGPWEVCTDLAGVYAPETDTAITNVIHPCCPDFDEMVDNMRLIAAAPDLLEACRVLLAEFEHVARSDLHFSEQGYGSAVLPAIFEQAHAAIAKATGQE